MMKTKKNKLIIIVAIFSTILLLSLCAILFIYLNRNTPKEGYVHMDTCSKSAIIVINKLKLPTDLIKSCKTQVADYKSKVVDEVTIMFGTPQDCPSGCFYSSYRGYVDPTSDQVYTIRYDNYDD